MALRRFPRPVLALAAAGLPALAGCGGLSTPPLLTPVPFVVPKARLLDLPLYVAHAIGADATQHLAFQFVSTPPADRPAWQPAAPTASRAPIFAYLAVQGDWVLLAPDADTGFRWRWLDQLPLAYSDLGPMAQQLLRHVLAQHRVRPALLEALPLAQARRLFLDGHLPFWILPAGDAAHLPPTSYAVQTFLTASTGPLPVRVLAAPPGRGERRAVAAALDQALGFIATHPAGQLARLVASRYAVAGTRLAPWIAYGQALGLWPHSVFPGRALYTRLSTTIEAGAGGWPPYAQLVDRKPAEQALLRSP